MRLIGVLVYLAICYLGAVTRLEGSEVDQAWNKEPTFFRPNYLLFGIVRNYPALGTENYLAEGQISPNFGFLHVISDSWAIGLTAGFKMLEGKDSSHDFPIASFAEEVDYIIRLYHPFYLLLGAKVMYLSVVTAAKVPYKRNQDYDNEVGAAAALNVVAFFTPQIALAGYLERWRGTKTMKLQGIESGFRIFWAI